MSNLDEKTTPVRCAEDDPHRCQSRAMGGQCMFLAIPGSQFCSLHGAHVANQRNLEGLYNLKRTEALNRLRVLRDHPDSKKLTVELGILRITLEELLNKCDDTWTFATNAPAISTLVGSIKDTLLANYKVEKHIGDLLSIGQVTKLAQLLYNSVVINLASLPESTAIIEKIAADFNTILSNPPSEDEKDV